jgi:hypothetical protein
MALLLQRLETLGYRTLLPEELEAATPVPSTQRAA